jgi:iron(III) transport system permease protein
MIRSSPLSPLLIGVALLLGLFFLYPLFYVLLELFEGGTDQLRSAFRETFSSPYQYTLIKNSLILAAGSSLLAISIGAPLAWLFTRYKIFAGQFFESLMILPLFLPPFIGAFGIRQIFARFGSINCALLYLELITAPIDWLGSYKSITLIGIQAFHAFPLIFFALRATLKRLDYSLEEAALISGASLLRRIWYLRLPLLLPSLIGSSLLVAVGSITDLGTPLLLEYRTVLSVQLYDLLSEVHQNPQAYLLTLTLAMLCGSLFFVGEMTMKGAKKLSVVRTPKPYPRLDLSLPSWIITHTFLGAVLIISLLPHVSILLLSLGEKWVFTALPTGWTFAHFIDVITHPLTARSLAISLVLSLCASTITVSIGLLITYAHARHPHRLQRSLAWIGTLPAAVPGLVMAFGYSIAFTGTLIDNRVNPFFLLTCAYFIRRLPYVLQLLKGGVATLDESGEEAARSLGASPYKVTKSIILPLLRSHLTAGFLICFAFSVIEVSDSLVLALEEKFYPVSKAMYALSARPDGVPMAAALGVIVTALILVCVGTASRLIDPPRRV